MENPIRDRPTARRTGCQRLLQALVAVTLLAFLTWRASPAGFGAALRAADPRLLLLAVLLNVPVALLYTVRTSLVLTRLGHAVPARTLLPIAVLGNVAGALTPAASGETVRVAMLRSHSGIGVGDGLAVVLYERAMSLGLMALGTGVALSLLLLPTPAVAATAALVLLSLALPSLLARTIDLQPAATALPARGGVLSRFGQVLRGSGGSLRHLLVHVPLQAPWSLLTVAIFALSTAQVWVVARSLSGSVNPLRAWIAFGGSQLAGIASMIPLGLGTTDGSLAVVLSRLGVPLASGVLVAIVWRVTTTLPLLLAGVASYLYLLSMAHHSHTEKIP